MTVWPHLSTIFGRRPFLARLCVGMICVVFNTMLIAPHAAFAAPSAQTINFSARLKSNTGSVVPDGQYNITFRIYDKESGGTPLWTEAYYDRNGPSPGEDDRIAVVNGYFNVKLGSLQAFSGIKWTDDLWLTMDIGDTSQPANPSTIKWDGEMTPRIQLSAVPYAMNANTVGGKSADQFVQLGQQTQTDASNNASISINKTGTGNLMELQSSGNDAFTINSLGNIVLGSSQPQSLTVASSQTGNGQSLTLGAGSAGTGNLAQGGDLILQGGAGNSGGASGSVIVRANGADNANAFQVQNAAGDTVLHVDTSTSTLALGNVSLSSLGGAESPSAAISSQGSLTLNSQGNMTIGPANDGLTLQGSYVDIAGNEISIGNSSGTTTVNNQLNTQNITVKNATNSANAFTVQNAASINQLSVDTERDRIVLGEVDTTGTLLVLDTKTTQGDPEGTNGAMYYNSALGKFRCFENGAWTDCVTPLPISKVVATTTTSHETEPKDVSDMTFTVAPHTKYYYKFIILHETTNPTSSIGFGVTTPAGPALSNWCVNTTSQQSTDLAAGHWGSYCGVDDAFATTTGSEGMGKKYTSTMEGYLQTGDEAGQLKLRMKASTNGETTILPGSFGILQIVQ